MQTPYRSGNHSLALNRIAFVGNYLPRQCGIATFTTDLCESLSREFPAVDCLAIPVNDTDDGYDYPARVRFELTEADISSYRSAADFLNINNIDLLSVQHEYGIFGGPAGSHVLALLREVRMPVVTTLHTILTDPDPDQRRVLDEIAERSDRLVVMSDKAARFLQDLYRMPEKRIDVIPHGIPDVPFVDPNFYKDQFGVEGKIVLLTFGLLSANKGIECVINALPSLLARYPNVVYVVLGATHPNVRQREGESYRLSLERLAAMRGVDKHVIFHNRFVSLAELNEFIGAADIYITPYLSRAQIVSGTLAYAVGAGKAVISTPYWYAQELLADGCGLVFPFGNSDALADQVIRLLDREGERHAMRKRAYLRGRAMTWEKVARRYMDSFRLARSERLNKPRATFVAKTLDKGPAELPNITIDHLQRLADDTGILQHAVFTVPDCNEGYTADDNARALIVSILLEEAGEQIQTARALTSRFLGFLWHAFNRRSGRFRNFLSYNRCWLEEIGSEDSHGRALWALGTVLARSKHAGFKGLAGRLAGPAVLPLSDFTSPRAWAFGLLGIDGYLRQFTGDRAAQNCRQNLLEKLLGLYSRSHQTGWDWFEDVVAYANATLPHSLLVTGSSMGRDDVVKIGLRTLHWLAEIQTAEQAHYVPIGSNGFYRQGGDRARFDQQPIEAAAMVSACLEAYRITLDASWHREARRAFEWFLGRNDLAISLYDPSTGGCRDGLHADRANENQGAESTLAFLCSLLEMRLANNVFDPSAYGKIYKIQPSPRIVSSTSN